MGVTTEQLRSIKVPTVIIPGNDNTHSSASGLTAHRLIPGAQLHQLPIKDRDVALIPFTEWAPYEEEIAGAFTRFIAQVMEGDKARPAAVAG